MSRWLRVACVLGAACGSHATFYDAPRDAPFSCPAFGETPEFSSTFVARLQQACTSYHYVDTTNTAVGNCQDVDRAGSGDFGYYNLDGPSDAIMTDSMSLPQSAGSDLYTDLRVTPRGTILVRHDNGSANALIELGDDSSGHFGMLRTTPLTTTQTLVAAYADADVHVILGDGTTLSDWTWAGSGALQQVGSAHLPDELGLTEIVTLAVTTDGLRAVLSGRASPGAPAFVYYTDRERTVDWFFKSRLILPLQGLTDLDLDDDCGTIWYPSQGALFTAQRQ